MKMKYYIRSVICLLILSAALVACSVTPRGTPSISPLFPSTPEPTPATQTAEPRTASPALPATVTEPAATNTAGLTPGIPGIIRITEERSIAGVRWSADGRFVQYATLKGEWWEYELVTGAHSPLPSPFDLDSQLWERLAARRVSETVLWFHGGISPSGTQVVYNRLPPGHNYTPAPDEFYLPPYEIWTAQSDGSNARSLGPCWIFGQVIWLDQERKIIFGCGYEGPDEIDVAAVDGGSRVSLLQSLSGRMALSSDETKLAITAEPEKVVILFLASGETRVVTDRGYVSGWSPDGQRLYYQNTEESWPFYDLHVYDLDSEVDTTLLSSPLSAAEGTTVTLALGIEVSPLENAAVFHKNSGVWLITWLP